MGVTHELKYKMNELKLNFPETFGLKRKEMFFPSPGASLDSCITFSVILF